MNQKRISTLFALAVVLGAWRGYLALYAPGAAEPKQIFPTRIETLPLADQAALEEGILVRNEQKLQSLLEDYLS